MTVYLLRHGATAFNAERRYQGTTDSPLSPEGEADICAADFCPETVYVTPLCRTQSTAARIFPDARQVIVPELIEMNFGVFEGRNAKEMEHDADYTAWVESGCESRCPGGETRKEFSDRTCAAFAQLVDNAVKCGENRLVIVAHGGTQMCVMERFALPHKPYFSWCGPNAGGYVLETTPERWNAKRELDLVDTVQYTFSQKGGAPW